MSKNKRHDAEITFVTAGLYKLTGKDIPGFSSSDELTENERGVYLALIEAAGKITVKNLIILSDAFDGFVNEAAR